jgi:hypothetical protein
LTLWPVDSRPASNARPPVSAWMSVVLPVPLEPTSETCSPRSSHRSAPCSRTFGGSPISRCAFVSSKTTRPGALGLAEADRHLARVARVDVDALDLVERLDARLRLLGLGRLRAEALDEALHPLDLGLLLADRLAERHLARGGLAAPLRPGAGEEARLAGLELEHGGADRLEEPAVVGDHDDRGVERLELGLQPLERVDVEVVGRLVEQQQVGLARERAAQRRARELAAGERRQEPVDVRVLEAEVVQHVRRAVAPRVAAAVLELALPARVAVVQRRLGRAGGHLLLHAPQVVLHRRRGPWRPR